MLAASRPVAGEPVPVGCHAFAVPVEPPAAPCRSGGAGGSRRQALTRAELAQQAAWLETPRRARSASRVIGCPCWSWYSAACRAAFRSASSPPSCASSPTRIPHPMPNELGVHNLTFEVDALQAILELAADRCHLVGGVGQYEAIWRMAAVRGPQGLSVNLARRIN